MKKCKTIWGQQTNYVSMSVGLKKNSVQKIWGSRKFGFNNFQNWWANMLWVKMFRGQQKFGKTILGVENLGVHIFGVLQIERSACTMGKRGPPLAYAIFYIYHLCRRITMTFRQITLLCVKHGEAGHMERKVRTYLSLLMRRNQFLTQNWQSLEDSRRYVSAGGWRIIE